MHAPPAKRVLLLLGIFVSAVFLASLLQTTEGRFAPAVTDLLVVCQYAKAMAEGRPFQYNPGEAPSSGATSLLHTSLLALAHAAGFRGEGLVAFAIGMGAIFYLASIRIAARAAGRLGGERAALLGGGLVALGGPVVWAFHYGSDIALSMLLALWLFDGLLLAWSGGSLLASLAAASLLALARPEGLPIALFVSVALRLGPARPRPRAERLLLLLPVALGILVAASLRAMTGSWLGSSGADKSLLAAYGFAEALAVLSEYFVDLLRGLLLGFYPSQAPVGFARGWGSLMFPPLGLLLVLLALARPPQALAAPLRLWAFVVAAVWALGSPNVFLGVHFNRHALWAFPTLLVLAACGLVTLCRLLGRDDSGSERALFLASASLVLVMGALATLRFAVLYGEMAGQVARRDLQAACWIERHLPPGTAMANVATSVEYLSGHSNLNLHGVTSPAFFGGRTAEREASMWEALARLPERERPAYLITAESAQESSAVLRELVEGAPLFRTLSFSDEILIQRMRWDLVGRQSRLQLPEPRTAVAGLVEVDRLNVCDGPDEQAHGYAFRSSLGGLPLHGAVRIAELDTGERVADGGRAILGAESFRVRTRPGRELLMVLRTARSARVALRRASGATLGEIELPETRIELLADGRPALAISFAPRPGWDERVLRVPGALVTREQTRLELRGRYAAFHYWFFQ